MQSFLQEVAADLYRRYGEDVSSLHILFPTRRARHFFIDALSHLAERPMWQPRWLTIDDLMQEVSGLHSGERIRLIAELYKVYSACHDEPFDKFYFWGEMLLNDFDTIDKYRIDADVLFRNIYELKELESDVSYLTPEQLEVIRQFWANFTDGATLSEEKRRFLAVWRTLGDVYHGFRARLQRQGIAYGGMMQRAAAERLLAGDFAFAERRRYVVAGFNALSACEKVLFRFLQHNAETDFYWDYDDYYLKNTDQEAGMFVRENHASFPPVVELSHDNFRKEKELTVVSTPSNAVQCKYAGRILDALRTGADGRKRPLDKETAVVLTDENLLLPLLHALPEKAGGINVTMGYPIKTTLAYAFLERLVELQAHRREGREDVVLSCRCGGYPRASLCCAECAANDRATAPDDARRPPYPDDRRRAGTDAAVEDAFHSGSRVAGVVGLSAAGRGGRRPRALRRRRRPAAGGVSGCHFRAVDSIAQFARSL